MHQEGWQVTGLDATVSADVLAQARDRYPVLSGTLPHADLTPASFHVITMWQSLEHVHDPLAVLQEARRLLMPGGGLLVTVPNIAGASFRWFGSAWFGLDLPRHLTHFTPVTLYRMMHRAGFQVGPLRMVRHPGWIRRSAALAAVSWRNSLLRTRFGAGLAAWYAYWTYQADCLLITGRR
jgi:SAM-dependent methyltransferase